MFAKRPTYFIIFLFRHKWKWRIFFIMHPNSGNLFDSFLVVYCRMFGELLASAHSCSNNKLSLPRSVTVARKDENVRFLTDDSELKEFAHNYGRRRRWCMIFRSEHDILFVLFSFRRKWVLHGWLRRLESLEKHLQIGEEGQPSLFRLLRVCEWAISFFWGR